MKKTLYSEISYILGQLFLTFGAALITTAGFGVSMVVAPAYLISEKISFMTFGMAEYFTQAVLLRVFCIVMRRVRVKYLFSFVTAFLYGVLLDFWLWVIPDVPYSMEVRVILFAFGAVFTIVGVTFFFKSYIPPEVYELFVQGISERFGFDMGRVKWVYDVASLLVAVGLSFAFFGTLRGVGVGTLICAAVNGPLISLFSRFLDRRFEFRPAITVPAWLK